MLLSSEFQTEPLGRRKRSDPTRNFPSKYRPLIENLKIHEIHSNENQFKNYLKLEGRTKNAYKSLTMIYVIVVN